MNLHAIVRGAITAVNPDISATYYKSIGNAVDANYKQTPKYQTFRNVRIQVQALAEGALLGLAQTDSLNLEHVVYKVYMYGNTQGIVRPSQQGGDLLQFYGKTFLVTKVMELWPDWSSIMVTEQITPP